MKWDCATAWSLGALLIVGVHAGCSTPAGGSGGWVDIQTSCDVPAGVQCPLIPVFDIKGGSDSGADAAGSEVKDTVPGDSTQATDVQTAVSDVSSADANDPDAPDYGNYFDDDVPTTQPDVPPVNADCNERAKIVYVVTEQNVLLSFDPDKLAFKKVGTLNCPAPGATPFSMSVDRNADAWVLYQIQSGFTAKGGGLYKVSTLDASCQTTSYVPNGQGFELFGMGFSANSVGSKDETFFIAGAGANNFTTVKNTLGTISFPGMGVQKLGVLDIKGGADLTGNGKGELFGFFPESTPPNVRQIDKTTAASGKTWPLPVNIFSDTQAWAFAQWGGDFYLFHKTDYAASSSVYKLATATGAVTTVLTEVGYTITGAGVSSCAPTGAATPPIP